MSRQIEKLRQQAVEKEAELLALLERTPIEVWNKDLDRFLAEWEVYFWWSITPLSTCELIPQCCYQMSCKAWENKIDRDSKGKKVNRRQATLLTRKSLSGPGKRRGNDYHDSEDEFRPTKRVAKAKRLAEPKQVRAEPTAVVPSKTTVDMEDDDDDDVPRPPPKRRIPTKKMKDESESDFDVAKGTKVKADNVDSDSEVEVLPAKGKGKTTETLKRQRCQSISIVSLDEF